MKHKKNKCYLIPAICILFLVGCSAQDTSSSSIEKSSSASETSSNTSSQESKKEGDLSYYLGRYNMVDENCVLTLEDNSKYSIEYNNNVYRGDYSLKQVTNEIGYKGRFAIYFDEQYPDDSVVSSYDLLLNGLDTFDELPESVKKFYENNKLTASTLNTMYLYIHTFVDAESFDSWGETNEMVGEISPSKEYKEIVYYSNHSIGPDINGSPKNFDEEDPYIYFTQVK